MRNKVVTMEEAVSHVKDGMTVFIGGIDVVWLICSFICLLIIFIISINSDSFSNL